MWHSCHCLGREYVATFLPHFWARMCGHILFVPTSCGILATFLLGIALFSNPLLTRYTLWTEPYSVWNPLFFGKIHLFCWKEPHFSSIEPYSVYTPSFFLKVLFSVEQIPIFREQSLISSEMPPISFFKTDRVLKRALSMLKGALFSWNQPHFLSDFCFFSTTPLEARQTGGVRIAKRVVHRFIHMYMYVYV